MTHDLQEVNNWFGSNKLAMNQSKTKSMLFCSNRSNFKDERLQVRQPHSDEYVTQTDEYKYLGLWLDPHLSFESHISKTCAKIKSRTGLLWRMRNVISQSLALDLYKSLIELHFTYGDTVYDGCNTMMKHKLQTTQNSALHAVMNVDPFYPSTTLHEKLQCDWLDVQRARHCSSMAYKGVHGLAPANINAMFVQPEPVRNLRSANSVTFIPRLNRTIFADKNFGNRCHKYWELIPQGVRTSPSLNAFKCNLKKAACFEHNTRH